MSTSSSLACPSRNGSLKPSQQLVGYLAGAVGTAVLLNAAQADAAVTAVSFGFGSTLSFSNGSFGYAGTTVGSYGTFWAFGQPFGVMLGGYGQGGVYSDYNHRAVFLPFGTVIGTGLNGTPQTSFFYDNRSVYHTFSTNQSNLTIGFETTSNNFGWANVSWDATNKALTINSAFVESTVGAPITIPEPSRALLALAGLGGVALRRRRKRAA